MSKPWSKKKKARPQNFRKDSTTISTNQTATVVPLVLARKSRVSRLKTIHWRTLDGYSNNSAGISRNEHIAHGFHFTSDVENVWWNNERKRTFTLPLTFEQKEANYKNAKKCTISYRVRLNREFVYEIDNNLIFNKTIRLDKVLNRKRFPVHRNLLSMCKIAQSNELVDKRLINFVSGDRNKKEQKVKFFSHIAVRVMCERLEVKSIDEVLTIEGRSLQNPNGVVTNDGEQFKSENIDLFKIIFAVNDYFRKHPEVRLSCGIMPFKGPQHMFDILRFPQKRNYYGSGRYTFYRFSTMMTIIAKLWSWKWATAFRRAPHIFSDDEFYLLLEMVNDHIQKHESDSIPLLQKYAGPQIIDETYDCDRVYYDIRYKYPCRRLGAFYKRSPWRGTCFTDPTNWGINSTPRASLQSIIS